MMFSSRKRFQISSVLRAKTLKKRIIIVGLKQDNHCREMLLRLLTWFAAPGDSVLAIHVQEPIDNFDPNTFHIHEDICKSKQVDYQVKVCTGDSFIPVLIHQVRLHQATMLVIGCSSPRPKQPIVTSFLKGLPPTCLFLVIDTAGKVLLEKQGTSQQGSSCQSLEPPSMSSLMDGYSSLGETELSLKCPVPVMSASESSESPPRHHGTQESNIKNTLQLLESTSEKLQNLAVLGAKGTSRQFMPQDLHSAINQFNPQVVLSEGSDSKVYRANLGSGQDAAVKILQTTEGSGEQLLQEVELLSGLNHECIVHLIGYCYSTDMHALVHNLFQTSLKEHLVHLRWSERMNVAVGVAKALEYLHHSCSPPIIHRDVRSSNILLSCHLQPQLSGFGIAMAHNQHQTPSEIKNPIYAVGTSAYLAPEYLMFRKIDQKIDVYSYGVVLLELITGKDATQDNRTANQESLVFQARYLLSHGSCDHLIDPRLNGDYNKEEMQRMIMAARLCIMHSSSRRPTVKTILKLLQDHEYWLKVANERKELMKETSSKGEIELQNEDLTTHRY